MIKFKTSFWWKYINMKTLKFKAKNEKNTPSKFHHFSFQSFNFEFYHFNPLSFIHF